jgi:hypothetical protein
MKMTLDELLASLEPIDMAEADYLYVAESSLPQAGKGLYTAIRIYAGEIIAVFEGELLSDEEAELRRKAHEDGYFIQLLNGQILDSMHTHCLAKYANDAAGSPVLKVRNNAVIALNEQQQICIVATRNIRAGEEVYVSYGKAYWAEKSN